MKCEFFCKIKIETSGSRHACAVFKTYHEVSAWNYTIDYTKRSSFLSVDALFSPHIFFRFLLKDFLEQHFSSWPVMVGYPRLPAFADAPACMDVASAPTSCLNPGVPPVRSGEQLCDLYLFFGGWRIGEGYVLGSKSGSSFFWGGWEDGVKAK